MWKVDWWGRSIVKKSQLIRKDRWTSQTLELLFWLKTLRWILIKFWRFLKCLNQMTFEWTTLKWLFSMQNFLTLYYKCYSYHYDIWIKSKLRIRTSQMSEPALTKVKPVRLVWAGPGHGPWSLVWPTRTIFSRPLHPIGLSVIWATDPRSGLAEHNLILCPHWLSKPWPRR